MGQQEAHPDPLRSALAFHDHMSTVVERAEAREAERAERAAEAVSRSSGRIDLSLDWAALRECESGGDYQINTGNGYYGAYQFSLSTWQSMGGAGLPSDAPPAEQDMRAQRLYDAAGPGQWPVCGSLL